MDRWGLAPKWGRVHFFGLISIVVSYPIQAMTLTTLNMLARWCRKIAVQLPSNSHSCLPGQEGQNLKEILAKQLSAIDPYGKFSFCNESIGDCDGILFIGLPEKVKELNERSVWIDGSGWVAGAGCGVPAIDLSHKDDGNPVGPAFASCLGVAEVFRRAIGLPSPKRGDAFEKRNGGSWPVRFDPNLVGSDI